MLIPSTDSGNKKLAAVIIHLESCSNRCLFCCPRGSYRNIEKEELKKIELYVFNQVKGLKRSGFRAIEISGNDPVEYEKIPQFISWLKNDMNFLHVRLATHGRNLRDRKLVKRLKEAGLDELKIPIYGSTGAIHDSVTQERGSFDETMKGIKNAREIAPGMSIITTFLIMKQNYMDAVNFLGIVSKYSVFTTIGIPCVSDVEYAKNYSVSFNDMKPHLLNLSKELFTTNHPFFIMDIPFCVFGFYQLNIYNKTGPPVFADNYSIPERFKSDRTDLPSYRVKSKLDICLRCSLEHICDGFYEKHMEMYDLSYLEPL